MNLSEYHNFIVYLVLYMGVGFNAYKHIYPVFSLSMALKIVVFLSAVYIGIVNNDNYPMLIGLFVGYSVGKSTDITGSLGADVLREFFTFFSNKPLNDGSNEDPLNFNGTQNPNFDRTAEVDRRKAQIRASRAKTRSHKESGNSASRGSSSENYYEILGVSSDCTIEQLKQSVRRLRAYLHPDRLADLPEYEQKRATERLKRVNIAYGEIRKRLGK